MFGNRSHKMRQVDIDGPRSIRISAGSAKEESTLLEIDSASWIGFVNVGDSFLANESGWWIIGNSHFATAISVNCPSIDSILRTGTLAEAADRVPELVRIDYADVPKVLRGPAAASGVVQLTEAEIRALRTGGTVLPVSSVRDFPILP